MSSAGTTHSLTFRVITDREELTNAILLFLCFVIPAPFFPSPPSFVNWSFSGAVHVDSLLAVSCEPMWVFVLGLL